MPSDFLLELDGIKGESADTKHKDTIDIDSFSWGVSQPRLQRGGGAGGGTGNPTFQDFTFTKPIDISSPALFLSCAAGKHIPKATLIGRSQGEQSFEYLKIVLEDVFVSSYQEAGADGGEGSGTSDSFSLNYSKIEFTYTPQTRDGNAGQPVSAGWDLALNKKA